VINGMRALNGGSTANLAAGGPFEGQPELTRRSI
jgi:hypothetical protein